jgi:hypothetical protein
MMGLFSAGIVVAVVIISCSKDLNKTNPNALPVDGYFTTSTQLLAGTNAIYSVIHSANLVGREWFFVHDLRGDDVATGGGQLEVPRAQILNGATDPTNAVMNSVWNNLFSTIHRANTVIVNGPNVTDNTALRDRCLGEAKFLRAWAYFELVSMWGAVPMYTKPVAGPNDFLPRSSVDAIYTQIVKDLTDAAGALPGKSAYGSADLGRATNAAANAMLGRVLMQKGDYTGAKTALLKIPSSGADGYSLTARYNDNFLEETEFNNESIFEVSFYDKKDANFNWPGNTSTGDGPNADQTTVRNQEYCPVAWRNLIPSNRVLNEYEMTTAGAAKTDPRFAFTIYKSGDMFANDTVKLTDALQNGNGSTLHGAAVKASWRKYTLIYKQTVSQASFYPGGDNMRLIRYAEVLLNLAECANETGDIGGAVGYLNQIRDRADVAMPHYPTAQFPVGSKDQVTKAIMHEKTVEMSCEEVRNIDILRWRSKGYFTTEPLSYFHANRDELLPIPQSEIDNNPKLGTGGINKQNPGY